MTGSGTPERILIIRPSALGDVCRTVPVLASLRAAYPGARIDWLVQEGFEDAVSAHPALTHPVVFPRAALKRGLRSGTRAFVGLVREIRNAEYEIVIDAQGLARSGLIALASGSARRVGMRQSRELAWLGLTDRVDAPLRLHTVDRMLALVEHLGVTAVRDMRLYVPERGRAELDADAALRGMGREVKERPIVLAPTSRWAGKQWPAERFAVVARELRRAFPERKIVIVGSARERGKIAELLALCAQDRGIIDRVGGTSVGMLMAIVSGAGLLIANDSAALHMGVGFGVPLVAIFGPTRVERVGPYGRVDDVVQRVQESDTFDHKDARGGAALMARVSTESVLGRAMGLLGGGAGR